MLARLAARFTARRCAAAFAIAASFTITLAATVAQAQQPTEPVKPLPGTQPLTWTGDLSLRMVDDLHAYADKATAASIESRARHWKRDFSSVEAYRKSIDANAERLANYVGYYPLFRTDKDGPFKPLIDQGNRGRIKNYSYVHYIQKWPNGFESDGSIWLPVPKDDEVPRPTIVLLLDADQKPHPEWSDDREINPGVKKFLDQGYRVVVPRLIDRGYDLSTVARGAKPTAQPQREFIYRQAFEMGRHVVGYELMALAGLLDYVNDELPIAQADRFAVVGYGEGGLLALYLAAIDPRVEVVGVSGYFGPRERLFDEPIYRNVWGLLDEFGDAELATMIAPNKLIVEAAAVPKLIPPGKELAGKNVTPGTLTTPKLADVKREIDRAHAFTAGHPKFANHIKLVESDNGTGEPWSDEFVKAITAAFDKPPPVTAALKTDTFQKQTGVPGQSRETLYRSFVEHTQALVRESEYVRKDYFAKADKASRDPAKWEASLGPYRKHLHEEVLGKIDAPLLPPNARTRQVYDTPKYTGYEVVLDVFDNDADKADANVFAFGVLLVPKDLKSGEKRPVVVCQHGLEGRPRDTIEAGIDGERYYHRFAHHLAERGFVTFSPQNPYIGKNHFRQLVRKLNPLKLSLWSIIVPQHEQITSWLAGLDFVDAKRIGFYGLSYGGKTAMRVPALVDKYCLSICSGDFNEWIRKCTSVRDPFSYMGTGEYEMFEFDLGHTFNYAEMAYLIAPRPFMVERGHRDGVGIDEWVGYEYGKVRLLYADLKIPERTEIEYFDGPHECHNVGTFDFLHRHLKWAVPK